jgi:biotin synthase
VVNSSFSYQNFVEFGGVGAMAVAMRPLTSRITLLRRLAALSHYPQQVASSSSIPRGHNSDTVVPCLGKVSSGYGAFVREYQSEVSRASSNQESPAAVAGEYAIRNEPRNDWMREEIQAIYESPLMDLLLYGVRCLTLDKSY